MLKTKQEKTKQVKNKQAMLNQNLWENTFLQDFFFLTSQIDYVFFFREENIYNNL